MLWWVKFGVTLAFLWLVVLVLIASVANGWYPGCGRTFWGNRPIDPDK